MASPSLPQTETRDSEPGYLQVGHNGRGEIVMNLPRPGDRTIPEQHIIFSPREARQLGSLLYEKAAEAENDSLWTRAAKLGAVLPCGHSIDSLFLVPPAGSACRACMAAFEEDYGPKGGIDG